MNGMFTEMYELFRKFEKKLERIGLDNKNLVWIDYFFKKGCVLECASRIFIEMQELFERKLEKIGVKVFFFKKGSVLERTSRMFIEMYEKVRKELRENWYKKFVWITLKKKRKGMVLSGMFIGMCK